MQPEPTESDGPDRPAGPDEPIVTTAITSAGPIPGYLVEPSGAGPWPAVVVLHELFGLTDDIRCIADRFAAAGYLTFAPDLLAAGSRVACIVNLARALARGTGPAIDQISATRGWLEEQPQCTGRVGVAGFCLGGGFAILLANQGFQASSTAYGRLPADLASALQGACPMVGSYGARDGSLPGAAAKLESALAVAGVPHDVKEYPLAGHSFMNDSAGRLPAPLRLLTGPMNAGMVEIAAEDAWVRIFALFDPVLKPLAGTPDPT